MILPYRILRIAVITNGIVQVTGVLVAVILSNLNNGELGPAGNVVMYLVAGTMIVGFFLALFLVMFPLIDKNEKRLPFYYLLAAIAETVLLISFLIFKLSGNVC